MEEKLREMKKKCPQFIKADLYSIGQFLILIALLIIAINIYKKERTYAKASFLVLAVGTVCFPVQLFFGKAKVNNKSGADIEYLNETESGNRPSYTLSNGEKQYDIDGIRYDGHVYKIPDGVHVTVKNGKVVPHSLVGKYLYHVVGGVLTSPPDESWNKLFDC